MLYSLRLGQIDQIFDWVRLNNKRFQEYRSFKELARVVAKECFKRDHPDNAFIGEIIHYLKEYAPPPSSCCPVCNGSGKIVWFPFGGVFRPMTKDCQICNGSGKDLSKKRIAQDLSP